MQFFQFTLTFTDMNACNFFGLKNKTFEITFLNELLQGFFCRHFGFLYDV